MPRIIPRDVRRARAISSVLASLLPVCRDVGSAQNELRWMQQHAVRVSQQAGVDNRLLLNEYVRRRAQGEPLQYILGTVCHGDLELRCRPGVLIPRPETAASVSFLVKNLQRASLPSTLRVLDLCTGSGCIPLLFHHEFFSSNAAHKDTSLELVGVDISPDALSLARENLIHRIAELASSSETSAQQMKSVHGIGFVQADMLNDRTSNTGAGVHSLSQALERLSGEETASHFDILISNPPYISPRNFRQSVSKSVRDYEPTIALVPPGTEGGSDQSIGDEFYAKLVTHAAQVGAKVLLMEVADMDQARRVAAKLAAPGWHIEIWRDEPDAASDEKTRVNGQVVRVRGRGHGRSVFAYRQGANQWFTWRS